MTTILTVDDEPIIRQASKIVLDGAGHTAIEADGGVEAKSRPLQLVRK